MPYRRSGKPEIDSRYHAPDIAQIDPPREPAVV